MMKIHVVSSTKEKPEIAVVLGTAGFIMSWGPTAPSDADYIIMASGSGLPINMKAILKLQDSLTKASKCVTESYKPV